MAITRIENNQITTATINADEKIIDNSVTAGKLESNMTYPSNLNVSGSVGISSTLQVVGTSFLGTVNAATIVNTTDTMYLNGLIIKNVGGEFVFYESDGVTIASINGNLTGGTY